MHHILSVSVVCCSPACFECDVSKTMVNPSKPRIPETYGYGSIPINTIFRGMNIHLPAILMFTRGTRFWHTAISIKSKQHLRSSKSMAAIQLWDVHLSTPSPHHRRSAQPTEVGPDPEAIQGPQNVDDIQKKTYDDILYWLVVLTILENISQWEGLSHILWNIKNVWNHQPV